MPWPWKRRTPKPRAPDVPGDWIERGLWLSWEAPRNYIAGEASYTDALRQLAGPVCEDGYCLAVAVRVLREPQNTYDPNAFRAEIEGRHVGYLRRHVAGQLASPLDTVGCQSFLVPGLLRGGSTRAANLGCHVWLDRRLAPGPAIELPAADPDWEVPWPPGDDEVRRATGLAR